MTDERFDQPAPDPAPRSPAPVVIKQGRGCIATLVGSALTIVVSALLGAAIALLVLWYGPGNFGLTFPDSTGRLSRLEIDQQTAVVERTDISATLRGLEDLRGSVNTLSESVQTLESSVSTRELDLDTLQKQITANADSLLAIQGRLDELESIPANAALANRIADVEVDLATVSTILERIRSALGAPGPGVPDSLPTDSPTTVPPTPTP